jgi:16S rRNA (guanine527-N7)-methyltransferase
MTPRMQLAQGLYVLEIDLPRLAQNKLLAYAALLDKWNRTYRLTGLKDPSTGGQPSPARFAGDPALCRRDGTARRGQRWRHARNPAGHRPPGTAGDLLDSNSKKTAFLQQVAIELGWRILPYTAAVSKRTGRRAGCRDQRAGFCRSRRAREPVASPACKRTVIGWP